MTGLSKKQKRILRKQGLLHENNSMKGFDLKEIEPQTEKQERAFEDFDSGYNLFLHGSAGTGKTFISLYLSLREITKRNDYRGVKIIRSAVPTRDIGYLPGSLSQKLETYEQPYRAICNELYGRADAYDVLKHYETIEFISTSYIRGSTISDSVVVVDEINNMTFHELDSIITRIGDNCKIIFSGDFRQSDLTKMSERGGLVYFTRIIDALTSFSHVEFDHDDIVRSRLVRDYIIAKEKLGIQA